MSAFDLLIFALCYLCLGAVVILPCVAIVAFFLHVDRKWREQRHEP